VGELRCYRRLARAALRADLEQPRLFWSSVACSAVASSLELVGIVLLLRTAGQIGGWNIYEVIVLACLTYCSLSCHGAVAIRIYDDHFRQLVFSGEFAQALTRPLRPLTWVCGSDPEFRVVGRFMVSLGVLVWATSSAGVRWGPVQLGLVVLSIGCTILVLLSISLMGASLALRTGQGITFTEAIVGSGISIATYPAQIFDVALRMLTIYVLPLGLTVYVPTLWLLGKDGPAFVPRELLALVPVLTAAFLVVALMAWGKGVRHYLENGGE